MLQLAFSMATAILPSGFADCPCVDPYPLLGPGSGSPNCSGTIRLATGVCYTADYGGRGCRAYDLAASDECVSGTPRSRPAWCLDRWCYVAPWNCNKPHAVSSFFDNALINNGTLLDEGGLNCTEGSDSCADAGRALSYSYETCGNIANFQVSQGLQSELDAISSRGGIRLTWTGDDSPYIKTLGANDTRYVAGVRKDGSVVKFVIDLLAAHDVPWQQTAITEASWAFSSSSFQACIHDVALNATDLCIGSTWAFENRRRLADFTGAITTSNLRLLVKLYAGDFSHFSYQIKQPFAPFTAKMWLALIGALTYIGYAMYTLDASGYDSDDENEDGDDELAQELFAHRTGKNWADLTDKKRERATKEITHFKKVIKYQEDWKAAFIPTTRDDWKDFATAWIHAIQSYLGGGDFRLTPQSVPSWIVFVGLSFLVLVITSNYTAQVYLVGSPAATAPSAHRHGVARLLLHQ